MSFLITFVQLFRQQRRMKTPKKQANSGSVIRIAELHSVIVVISGLHLACPYRAPPQHKNVTTRLTNR